MCFLPYTVLGTGQVLNESGHSLFDTALADLPTSSLGNTLDSNCDRVSFVQSGTPFLQASSVWQHQTIHDAGRREDLLNCCTKVFFTPVARYSCPARLSDNLSGAGCKPSSASSGSVGGTAALSVC